MVTKLSPDEKAELDRAGYFVTDKGVKVVRNYRSYYDPRKDEKGNVMGWTQPMPSDPLRMLRYLRKGFLLQDPEGHMSPPKPMRIDPRLLVVPLPGQIPQVIQCPLCERTFQDKDALISHMPIHKGKGKGVKKNGHKRRN